MTGEMIPGLVVIGLIAAIAIMGHKERKLRAEELKAAGREGEKIKNDPFVL